MLKKSTGSQELSAGNQLSAIAEIEWILAESSDTEKKVSCKPSLHHTVRQNWEGSHFRGSTAVSKRYNGSKPSSRVGCRTDAAEVSRLDFIWTSC